MGTLILGLIIINVFLVVAHAMNKQRKGTY